MLFFLIRLLDQVYQSFFQYKKFITFKKYSNPRQSRYLQPFMIPQVLNTRMKQCFFSSKVIKADDGQLLQKYGQAYFPLRSIEKQDVSQKIKNLLNSYPCWLMKQSLVSNKEFKDIAKNIVSADPKEVYVFQEKQQLLKFYQSSKVLSCIETIKFTYLKVLHIMLTTQSNFQEIGWVDAPILQQLYISTQGSFYSIKPMQKSNFKNLLIVNFRGTGVKNNVEPRMFNNTDFHRTKLFNSKRSDPLKSKIYIPPGTINICRLDLSNINLYAKLEIERLTNFHVPHLQLSGNQHHHFTPNADYPWCPELQFSQSKIYKSLNQKFDNKTVALSIIDYVFGNGHEEQMQIENRMVRQNINQNPQNEMIQDDYEEIDSDLDGPMDLQNYNEFK